MAFYCKWWDCPLELVAEHQQEDCERNGMDCQRCMEQAEEDERLFGISVEEPFNG